MSEQTKTPHAPQAPSAAPETGGPRWRPSASHAYLGLIGLLCLGLGGVYLSGRRGVQRVQAAATQERALIAADSARARQALMASHRDGLAAQAEELLTMSGLPLAWAIRTELLQKDYREVGVYFRQLVQQPKVRRALLVSPDGRVKVASDQKAEGALASEVLAGVPLDGSAPRVHRREGEVLVVVPVMGLTSRLGVVVVGYSPEVLAPPPGGAG